LPVWIFVRRKTVFLAVFGGKLDSIARTRPLFRLALAIDPREALAIDRVRYWLTW
jgi:hypothetical protein